MNLKRTLALLLALLFTLSLCACGVQGIPVDEPASTPESGLTMPQIVLDHDDEPSGEPVKENPVKPDPAQTELTLSNDMYDFTFEVEGAVYQFPCLQDEFLSRGWAPAYDISEDIMKAGDYSLVSFKKDDLYLRLILYNGSGNNRPYEECTVVGLTADNEADYAQVYMAGGILANNVTQEMAIKYFGEPISSSHDEDENYASTYRYSVDDESKYDIYYTFWYDSDTGEPDYLWVNNRIPMDGYDDTSVDGDYPALYNSYSKPSAMNYDPVSGVVKFGGDLYQLPVPLMEITANGWEITELTVESIPAGGNEYNCVTLQRGSEEIVLSLANFSDKLTYAENCCVKSFKQDTYGFQNNVELVIPGGIQLGMSKGELKSALPEGYNTSDDLYSWYDWDHGISIWVFLDYADKVRSVEYEKDKWE